MRQWKSLVPALHLHAPAPPCFPHPAAPSPSDDEDDQHHRRHQPPPSPDQRRQEGGEKAAPVRLVGCDGRVRAYAPPVTARELMQQHPRHLVCRADALLIGERLPAVAAGEELQPGQAYFLLPAHLFRSVLSFVSLASSLLLLLSTAAAGAGTGTGTGTGGNGKGEGNKPPRPFELHRTASGTLQIKFSDDFLLVGGGQDAREPEKPEEKPAVLRGDDRLAKDYEDLVGYSKSRRWAPKLETIEEVAAAAAAGNPDPSSPASATERSSRSGRKSRALPFLGRLGSRRRRDACSAVACSG